MDCLAIIVMGHFPKKYKEGLSSSPHAERVGSVQMFITEMSVELQHGLKEGQ